MIYVCETKIVTENFFASTKDPRAYHYITICAQKSYADDLSTTKGTLEKNGEVKKAFKAKESFVVKKTQDFKENLTSTSIRQLCATNFLEKPSNSRF